MKSALVACLVLLLARAAPASGLTFTPDGQIAGPGGTVSFGISGAVAISTAGGDTFTLSIPTNVKGGKAYWSGGDLADKKRVVDTAKKQTTFSATITDPALAAPIPVSYSIALTPEGKARITLQYGGTEPVSKSLSLAAIFFYSPREPLVGSTVAVNGAAFPITHTPRTDHWTLLTTDGQVVHDAAFFGDNPYRTVTAHVVTASSETVSDENLNAWQSVGLRVLPLDNLAVIDVDLPEKVKPQSAETYGGVDYYAAEHLHLPQYRLSRNLIQNPSFEQGLQFWNFGVWGKLLSNRIPDYYVLDSTQAHSGRKCLKILGQQGDHPAPFSSFAIPVENGKQYTLSFYAKGDRPNLNLGSDVFPGGAGKTAPIFWGANLTQTWQRYSYTFAAPGPALDVQFGVGLPAQDCAVYVDDVQLEEGPLTEFTHKALGMVLATDHRDNVFKPGVPIHGRWEMTGLPGASGTLAITLRNFLGEALQQHAAAFHLRADGTAVVPEPWLEHVGLGLYTVEATATTSDHFRLREYGRLTIAPPADPTVKHHALFALGGTSPDVGSWERLISHLQYFGIGSAVNFDPPPHGHLAVLAAHHVVNVTAILDGGNQFGTIKLQAGWTGRTPILPPLKKIPTKRPGPIPRSTTGSCSMSRKEI